MHGPASAWGTRSACTGAAGIAGTAARTGTRSAGARPLKDGTPSDTAGGRRRRVVAWTRAGLRHHHAAGGGRRCGRTGGRGRCSRLRWCGSYGLCCRRRRGWCSRYRWRSGNVRRFDDDRRSRRDADDRRRRRNDHRRPGDDRRSRARCGRDDVCALARQGHDATRSDGLRSGRCCGRGRGYCHGRSGYGCRAHRGGGTGGRRDCNNRARGGGHGRRSDSHGRGGARWSGFGSGFRLLALKNRFESVTWLGHVR